MSLGSSNKELLALFLPVRSQYHPGTMALATSELDRCAVCRRHFLQGEAIRLFREPQSRGMQRVCPLCTASATHRGWELCEATREIPLVAHGDPARHER